MEELDDILQHFGKKGMKWGVRKMVKAKRATSKERRASDKDVRTKMKSKQISVKQGRAALLENVHKSNQSSKTYTRNYDKRIKAGQKHTTAIRGATADTKAMNTLKMKVGASLAISAASYGAPIVRNAYKMATSPQAIRAGKNIIQAAKGSPIRYVNGKAMTNVI